MADYLDDVALLFIPKDKLTSAALNLQSSDNLAYLKGGVSGLAKLQLFTPGDRRTWFTAKDKTVLVLRYSRGSYDFGPNKESTVLLPDSGIHQTHFSIELDSVAKRFHIHFDSGSISMDGRRYAQGSMAELWDDAQIHVHNYKFSCRTVSSLNLLSYSDPNSKSFVAKFMVDKGIKPTQRMITFPVKLGNTSSLTLPKVKVFSPEPYLRHYRGECLGTGGQGEVYKYEHPLTNMIYAAKIVKWPTDLTNVDKFKHVKRESRLARAMHHECLVDILEVFYYPEGVVLLMPYFSDGDLTTARTNGMSIGDCLSVMRDIWSGVEYLNNKGAMHRDLKPANILIRRPNPLPESRYVRPMYRAVLADFGFLTFADSADTACFSKAWTAPEMYNRAEPYDHSVDRYSMGLILFWLMTYDPPAKLHRSKKSWYEHLGSHIQIAIDCTVLDEERDVLEMAQKMAQYEPSLRPSMEECRQLLWKDLEERSEVHEEGKNATTARVEGSRMPRFSEGTDVSHSIEEDDSTLVYEDVEMSTELLDEELQNMEQSPPYSTQTAATADEERPPVITPFLFGPTKKKPVARQDRRRAMKKRINEREDSSISIFQYRDNEGKTEVATPV